MVALKEMKRNKSKYFKIITLSTNNLPIDPASICLFFISWRVWLEFSSLSLSSVVLSHFQGIFATYKIQVLQVWFFFSFSTLKGVIHCLQTSVIFWWEIRNDLYFSHYVMRFLSASFVELFRFQHFTVMSQSVGLCIWRDWGSLKFFGCKLVLPKLGKKSAFISLNFLHWYPSSSSGILGRCIKVTWSWEVVQSLSHIASRGLPSNTVCFLHGFISVWPRIWSLF